MFCCFLPTSHLPSTTNHHLPHLPHLRTYAKSLSYLTHLSLELSLLHFLGRLPRWPLRPSPLAPCLRARRPLAAIQLPTTTTTTTTTTTSEFLPNKIMTRPRMTRPRSHTFYLPLAPSDAPLSLKAKLSVLPPQAANALLAPRARSSTAPSTPCSNSDSPNFSAHDNLSSVVDAEDECARLERVLGCTTRAKDGTSRYRAASPELRNDWSTPSPPRSPPRSPNAVTLKEIIHVDMDLDPPPVVAPLPTPPPTPVSLTDHYQSTSVSMSASAIPELLPPPQASDEPEPEMVFQLDNDEVSTCPSSLAASPRTEVTSHRRC